MRCFIAAPCPAEIAEKLASAGNQLKGFGGLKLVRQENIHMTLKFLGEVSEEKVGQIARELEFLTQQRRINVTVKGLGAFPKSSHANVVWAGVEDPVGITELQRAIDEHLKPLGSPPEERFHPHYTIARVKYAENREALAAAIKERNGEEYGSYTLGVIQLMESRLSPDGPAYRELQRYPLV